MVEVGGWHGTDFLADLAEDVCSTLSGEVPVFPDSLVEDNGLTKLRLLWPRPLWASRFNEPPTDSAR
jgi:hypothetical protein